MNRSALLALTAAGLMFGLTVPLSKVALGWLDPAWLAAVRFGLAAPILALVARRTLRAAMTPRIAAWGAAGYGAMVVLQNFGVERTSVTHAAIIFGAVPVFVAAGSALAGRAVAGPAAWSGFGVALGGVALVAGSGGAASPAGDLLVLASAVLGSALIVVQGELLEGRDPVAVTAVQMGAAGLFALVFALPTSLPVVAPTASEGDRAGRADQRRLADPVLALRLRAGAGVGRVRGRVREPRAGGGRRRGRARVRQPVRLVAGARRRAGDRRAGAQRWRIRAPRPAYEPGSGARLPAPPDAARRSSAAAPPNINGGWVGVGSGVSSMSRPGARIDEIPLSVGFVDVDPRPRSTKSPELRRSRPLGPSRSTNLGSTPNFVDPGRSPSEIDETRPNPSLPSRR